MSDVRGAETFRAPAIAYDRFMGRYAVELATTVADAVGPRPGERVLDIGCGPGALTAELARRVGAEHVAAVDPSPTFAAACAERLPGVDVRVAAAEALPFPDDDRDHCLSQLVVNFLTDAPTAVAEMRRVTRPGGTVVAAVWDYAGEMTLLRTFWDAVVALDPRAAERDEGRSMPYATPETLHDLWSGSGLTEVAIGDAVVTAAYDGFTDVWQALQGGVGPAGAYVARLGPEAGDALATELRGRLGVGDRPFGLTAKAWVAVGRVPAWTSPLHG